MNTHNMLLLLSFFYRWMGIEEILSSGGQDSISAAGAHAALLSSANAGTGYMAFA
jgi:hypothetical protein